MPVMYAQQACTFGAGSDAGKQKLQSFGLIDSYRNDDEHVCRVFYGGGCLYLLPLLPCTGAHLRRHELARA